MLISITVIVAGEHLDPKGLSTILGVTPHLSRLKGDVRISPTSKNKAVSKFGLWEWRSKDPSESLSINGHIARLKSTFVNVGCSLATLPNAEHAWIDIHIVVDEDEEETSNTSFLIDVESLSTLSNLGLPVEVTVDVLHSAGRDE